MEYIENNLSCTVYCSLRESVGWTNFPKEQMEKALSSSVYTVVVFEDQQPVGMGRLIGDGIYYAIVDVAVLPAYQNRGIGKNIVHMLVQYVDTITPAESRSSVQLISEKGKEVFYEKIGFVQLPTSDCGSGMRKLIRKQSSI